MKKVNVVLPVYYVKREWLEKSILSVLEQDYNNLELIIVNDGATEDFSDLINKYQIKKYVVNERNMKLPYSLNRGFEIASGEYHTWTSADNFMLPGMISRLVRELDRENDLDIIFGKSKKIDENGNFIEMKYGEIAAAKRSDTSVYDKYLSPRYTYFSTLGASFMYRSKVWESLGGYNEAIHGAEDYDFWIRASREFKIKRIPWDEEPLYAYRVHSKSISNTVPGCYIDYRINILKQELKNDSNNKYLRKAIRYYSLNRFKSRLRELLK